MPPSIDGMGVAWMRARVLAAVSLLVMAGCGRGGSEPPPVATATATMSSPSASPTDGDEARLAALRATDQFDEFAPHERAALADGARLAWENFAPIVDGERVEWTNKAELWDAIAPKIRDEALLLGLEYTRPLWDNTNAIPNVIAMSWNDEDTGGRGYYAEFGVTILESGGPAEHYWGLLIGRDASGAGTATRTRKFPAITESNFSSAVEAHEHRRETAWEWIYSEPVR